MRGRQVQHRQRASAQRFDFGERFLLRAVTTRPLEPTQIAPDFSTTGSKAAAKPPVMGFTRLAARHAGLKRQRGSLLPLLMLAS